MKKVVFVLGIPLVVTLILSLLSFYYTRKIEKEMKSEILFRPRKIRQAAPEEIKRQLRVSSPEEYGMVVIDEYNRPQTQEGWDTIISQKVNAAKMQLSQDELEKMLNKIKEDPEKTAEKIKTIDENIQKCQEILKADPTNKEAQERLERLRILRSIARYLP